MFNSFRSGNPVTVLLLAAYALVLKGYFLLHPRAPLDNNANGYLYDVLTGFLDRIFHGNAAGFTALAVLLLFIQALLLNRIVNDYRVLPRSSFLPAMVYLLFTSFFRDWNYFSSAVVANTLLLGVLANLLALYSKNSARGTVFNTGLLIGIAALFYVPAVFFLVLLWATLLINRPFNPAEWIIAVTGMLCPYYFLGTWLFLEGGLSRLWKLPVVHISYPSLQEAWFTIAAIALVLLFFIIGAIRLRQHFLKMLIQVRKIWLVLLIYVLIAILISFLALSFSINIWIFGMVPLAVFIANAFWYTRRKALANVLHLALFAFAIVTQFFGS